MKSYAIHRYMVKPLGIKIMESFDLDNVNKLSDLSKKIRIDNAHLTQITQEMQKEGLVDRKLIKAQFHITVTKKGIAFAKAMMDIKKIVENWEAHEKFEKEAVKEEPNRKVKVDDPKEDLGFRWETQTKVIDSKEPNGFRWEKLDEENKNGTN